MKQNLGRDTMLILGELTMDERLTKLEIKLAYTEETVQALDAVVCAQAQEIAILLNRIDSLERRFTSLVENGEDSLPENERPPHY